MDGPAKLDDGNSGGSDKSSSEPASNSPIAIATSAFNLDLLPGMVEDFNQVNWYDVSVTAFHIGVFTLIGSSGVVIAAFLMSFVSSSGGLLNTVTRAFTVSTVVPIVLAIYGIVSRWSWNRMDESSSTSESFIQELSSISLGRRSTLLISCVVSLFLALILRIAIYQALQMTMGSTIEMSELPTVIVLDGLYIGPLLMAVGGFATLLLEPSTER